MARVLRIPTSDYKVIVGEGNTITLDTTNGRNNGAGRVIITGDLEVKGDTTTIESTIVSIEDNIIVLSAGNTADGLPASLDRPYSSGIEIDRGTFTNARWVYDDSISWSLGGTVTGVGTWLAEQGSQRLPIATPGIVAGGNLYVSVGNGIITVQGSVNYEEKVFRYIAGEITPDPVTGLVILNDDAIPNAKSIIDFVDYSLVNIGVSIISQDNSSVQVIDKNNTIDAVIEVGSRTIIRTVNSHGYRVGDFITITGVTTSPLDSIIEGINGTWVVTDIPTENTIEFNRSTTGGDPNRYTSESGRAVSDNSRIAVTVENSQIANFYQNRFEFYGLKVSGTEISTTESNASLVLGAAGTGNVLIKDVLEISETPNEDDGSTDPSSPQEGIRIYSKQESTGDTGLYFVNKSNTGGEFISKNRALLFSMLF
jgi:hypothetical protein